MEIITVNGKPVFRSSTQSFYDNQFSQKVLANIDTKTLFKKIDAIPGLAGAGIVYINSKYNIIELRKFEPVCQLNPIKIVLREPPQLMSQAEFASHLKGSQGNIRESKLVGELGNAAWSCGTAVLGWTVIIGSLGAIPLTGGTSSAITYLAIAGATAGSAQCFNGLIRVGAEAYSPELKDDFDSQEWYQYTTSALDLVSLAGAGAAALGTIKAVKMMQLGTSKNTYEILKGLSRAEKKRLNREITRLNLPGASGKLIKSMARKGNIKKYTGKQITHAFRLHLMDAIGASMSVSGSAFNGTIGTIAIGIYEELAD